jgi:hypothetical protein
MERDARSMIRPKMERFGDGISDSRADRCRRRQCVGIAP